MLDLRYVTDNLEEVRQRLAKRGAEYVSSLDEIAKLAEARRALIVEIETMRAELNVASKEMAKLDKKSDEFKTRRESLGALGQKIKEREKELEAFQPKLEDLVLNIPNLPHESTPTGKSEHDNVVVRTWGEPPELGFDPKDHVELGTSLGILDFERAVKVSGTRFTILRGMGARLERAIMMFMLDLHTEQHGYEELWPPALVRDSALRGTGQLPKFEADLFKVAREYAADDTAERVQHYLSPTAEVQVTNFHADEIFEPGELPRAYCAYTACFRSEAGSYGKDTRGLIRQHQFDKVELVHFCRPEEGEAMLDTLVGHAQTVLEKLGLVHRTIQLCSGDMGFSAQKAYDVEVWLPSQRTYREISSCSWFGDFQARRAKIRYRPDATGKPRLANTLNGSGLAIGRTLVAILEQNQQADGTVVVPEALRPYMGGHERIVPRA